MGSGKWEKKVTSIGNSWRAFTAKVEYVMAADILLHEAACGTPTQDLIWLVEDTAGAEPIKVLWKRGWQLWKRFSLMHKLRVSFAV